MPFTGFLIRMKGGIIMKKVISGVLALILCAGMLCACDEIESSSVQAPMSTTTPSVSTDVSGQTDANAITEQSGESQSETSSNNAAEEAPYLKITMKDWNEMNTDSKYINMESILKYITDSGVVTSLDVVDLVSALDKSGNTSKKKTAYELALKEINKNNKKSS